MAKTKEERIAERVGLVWDNDPEVRALQEISRAIYEDTGRWDTPEQQELNKQANLIRQSKNPLYKTVIDPRTGPKTQSEADRIYPKDTTPTANAVEGAIDRVVSSPQDWGGYLKVGLAILGLMAITSLFRGR